MKKIIVLFLFSFLFHVSGAYANAYVYFTNFTVNAYSNETYVTQLTKTIDGPQSLIVGTYLNRNLKIRMVSQNSTSSIYNGDTGYYKTLSIGDGQTAFTLGNDLNSSYTTYIYFTGNKKLYMKTSAYWLDTTAVNGLWNVNG